MRERVPVQVEPCTRSTNCLLGRPPRERHQANAVRGRPPAQLRLDLTEDGLYTLSTGTKNILGRINPDEPVTIKFYATNDDRVMHNLLKPHARSIEDLLLEYEKQSHGNVTLEVIHPNPDTDDEQKAKDDEIRGMTVNQEGDQIYLGLSVQSLDRKEILPFLNPEDATAFEYDVSRAIAKVIKSKKTIIGVMSAMPIAGVPSMPFQQQRGPEAWAVVQQLKADYEVRDLPMTTAKIDPDITVLLVVHPADISKSAEFAIDQYLLGGGNVIAFVDPQSLLAQAMSTQPNQMTGQPGNMITTSSDLPTLFKSWGISYLKDMVVADMNFRGVFQNRPIPTALQLPNKAINQDDHVTHGLQSFTLMNAGAFGIDRKDGLNVVTLASSSEASEMIDTAAAEKLRREPMVNFTPSGKKQVLGVHISGKFKTAFRRFFSSNGTNAHIEGVHFKCWYYNPSFVVNRLKNNFDLLSIEGLCTIVPPSYIEGFAEKRPLTYKWLIDKENKLKSRWPWKYIGDYYIISLQKK